MVRPIQCQWQRVSALTVRKDEGTSGQVTGVETHKAEAYTEIRDEDEVVGGADGGSGPSGPPGHSGGREGQAEGQEETRQEDGKYWPLFRLFY